MKSLLRNKPERHKEQDLKHKSRNGNAEKEKEDILRLSQMIFLEKKRRMRL